ncbi:hypothetical protein [Nocardia nova]
MSRRRFRIREFVEFLAGGNVATQHVGPIPIWAGFIIEQNAHLIEILENFMTSSEAQLQADIASLVDSNTKIVALAAQQSSQISDLRAKNAELQAKIENGETITTDDLAALHDITAKLADTASTTADTAGASATAPAPSTPAAEPQQPIVPGDTSAPADSTATDAGTADAGATAPATDPTVGVPVQQPIVPGDTSAPADAGAGDKVSGADQTTTTTVTDGSTAADGTSSTGYGQ